MINEFLQWLVIAILVAVVVVPPAVRVYRDFTEEDREE